jgi:hypothetical protein
LEMIASLASNQSSWQKTGSLWQAFYWIAFVLIFAWAVWQRFRLPLDPIADPDTWGYLSPALRKLTGAEFGHTNGRNFVYPGFVFLLLRLFADFRAITVAQHFLGLLAGAVFLLTWKRARIFVPNPRIGRVAHDLLGLAGAAIFLLQWQTIVFEKEIRPEGICAFVLSITFYLLIQFLACFFLEHRRTATIAFAFALAFAATRLSGPASSSVFRRERPEALIWDAMGELREEYEPTLIRDMLASGMDAISITLCDPKPEGAEALALAVDSLLAYDRYLSANSQFFVKANSVADVDRARREKKMAVFYLYQNTVQFGMTSIESTCSTGSASAAASSPTTRRTSLASAAGRKAGSRHSVVGSSSE